ncbi:hypothetical protein DFH09DRAFT_1320873 [Mycena vulgaris]|nr:hypothetical protein DFH09DRAFT_1320873 [Mycena vulgaris]
MVDSVLGDILGRTDCFDEQAFPEHMYRKIQSRRSRVSISRDTTQINPAQSSSSTALKNLKNSSYVGPCQIGTIIFWVEDNAFGDGTNPKVTTFFHALAISPALPPTLKNLAISWNFEGEDYYENMPPVDEPGFALVRRARGAIPPSDVGVVRRPRVSFPVAQGARRD